MKKFLLSLLILVPGTVWGISFIVVELILPVVPPITITLIRSIISVIMLTILMRLAKSRLPSGWSEWWPFILLATTNLTVPFFLTVWAQVHIEGSLASILLSIMPLFTMLLAYRFTEDEPLTLFKVIGISLGLIGIIILIGPSALDGMTSSFIGQLAIVSAALLYSIGAVYLRYVYPLQPKDLSAWALRLRITSAQFIISVILLLPFSLWLESPWTIRPNLEIWSYLIFLGIGVTFLATMVYFYLIEELGASMASTTIYLIPVAGVLLGFIVLGEALTLAKTTALGFILTGIFMANYGRRERLKIAAQRAS